MLKLGLFIGINYIGTEYELNGCINDVNTMKKIMIDNKIMGESNIITMTDESKDDLYPTNINIKKKLEEIVAFCNNTDREILIVFTYSGHGASIKDDGKDEIDGCDEAICPIDHEESDLIRDDYFKAEFLDKLDRNVYLFMLYDCCHSGTICDLRYNYKTCVNNYYEINFNNYITYCNAIMISGCKDDQTSADAYINKKYQGALTAAFLSSFNLNKTYRQIVNDMVTYLKNNKYDQIPQFSAGRRLNLDSKTMLTLQ